LQTMKRKYEYIEGQKARENFERLAEAVFQLPPKHKAQKKRQPKKATARKTSGKNKG
jgi:hypothetical protein